MKIKHFAVSAAAVLMVFACAAPPQTPTGVTASPGNESITIACDEDESVLMYNLYWSMAETVSEESNLLKSITLPYTHRGLENDSSYYYAVSAVNAEGESTLSETVTASPQLISVPAPTAIETIAGEGQIELSWPAVAGAYSYNLYWSTTAGVSLDSECIMNVSMPYVHTGLSNGQDYYYRITSVDSDGESELSTEVSASPRVLYSMQLEKLLADDGEAGDYFGCSVSSSGDYALIGSRAEDDNGVYAGAAYVYHRTGANSWDGGTKLLAFDGEANDQFGYSVSIDGYYALIGAYSEDENGNDAGAAYVFRRIGENSWDNGTKLLSSDGETGDYFGFSVSISGDYAIIGAYSEDSNGPSSGAAYVFRRIGENSWDTGTKIMALDGYDGHVFGGSVSIAGNYALVGANCEDANGANAGAAYIFRRTGENSWDAGTKLLSFDGEAGDFFGVSVSIDGDFALIGASSESENGLHAGAAYVFRRIGENSWDSGTKLLASDGEADDFFGRAVSINGDYALIGAGYKDENGTDAGAAYIFKRNGANAWSSGTKLLASDGEASDYFGLSVSIDGDYALIGASCEDDNGSDAGATYIF